MSADNGIYIIPVHRTKWSNEKQEYYTPEVADCYLVTHQQAIDNAFYEPDRKDGYNSDWVIRLILDSQCQKHLYREAAIAHAVKLEENTPTLEYGISTLQRLII